MALQFIAPSSSRNLLNTSTGLARFRQVALDLPITVSAQRYVIRRFNREPDFFFDGALFPGYSATGGFSDYLHNPETGEPAASACGMVITDDLTGVGALFGSLMVSNATTIPTGWTASPFRAHRRSGIIATAAGHNGFDGNPHPGEMRATSGRDYRWDSSLGTLGVAGVPHDVEFSAGCFSTGPNGWTYLGGSSPNTGWIWSGLWWRWQGLRGDKVKITLTDPGDWGGSGYVQDVTVLFYEYDPGTDTLGTFLASVVATADGWHALTISNPWPTDGTPVTMHATTTAPDGIGNSSMPSGETTVRIRVPLKPPPAPWSWPTADALIPGATFT